MASGVSIWLSAGTSSCARPSARRWSGAAPSESDTVTRVSARQTVARRGGGGGRGRAPPRGGGRGAAGGRGARRPPRRRRRDPSSLLADHLSPHEPGARRERPDLLVAHVPRAPAEAAVRVHGQLLG